MTTGWIFRYNWAMLVSQCLIVCKNPQNDNQKYTIEFNFINGKKYTAEFTDKKARDDHFRLIIRMMEQNYRSPYTSYFHWALHALGLAIIMCLCAIV